MVENYLHGYSDSEQVRLLAQNEVLAKFVYDRIDLSDVGRLVELGTGVGAQLVHLLEKYPALHATGIDISARQLNVANGNLKRQGVADHRFHLLQADASNTGLVTNGKLDAGLVVWLLEHVANPQKVLRELKRILKPGGVVYITEVFNQSFYVSPSHPDIERFWHQMNEYQRTIGGDPNVGAKLGQLLSQSGYEKICVRPYVLHYDRRDPVGRSEILAYWGTLVSSAYEEMARDGFTTERDWREFQQAWQRLEGDANAVFYYAFIQGFAETPLT